MYAEGQNVDILRSLTQQSTSKTVKIRVSSINNMLMQLRK
jgi:hypothetical protein